MKRRQKNQGHTRRQLEEVAADYHGLCGALVTLPVTTTTLLAVLCWEDMVAATVHRSAKVRQVQEVIWENTYALVGIPDMRCRVWWEVNELLAVVLSVVRQTQQ